MSIQFAMVPLGNLLKQSDIQADIQPDKSYRLVTVKLWGKGVELRSEVDGASIINSKLFIVRENQFILSKIDARNGAFGLIPAYLNNAVVSSDFPVFSLNTSRVLPEYLNWMSKTADFVQLCAIASEGTTNRVRLKIDRFLASTIPLPPLQEQRRIVARIEELVGSIEEARGLRKGAVEDAEQLWLSNLEATFNKLTAKYPERFFRDICDVVRGGSPRPAGDPTYYDGHIPFLKVADLTKDSNKFVTTYSATIKEAGLSRSRYIDAGTLMLTNSGATLGVPKICTFGTCFNDGIQAFLNLPEDIFIEYLYYFFTLKTVWFREWAARGQGQPNLNTDMVKNMSVPIPPLTEQKSIVAYLDKTYNHVANLRRKQAEAIAELNALLPSILDKAFKGEL